MSLDRAAVRTVDESTGHRIVQVTVLGDDDTRDDVEHIEPFGFTSAPPAAVGQNGPDAVVVDVGDTSDHQVVIVIGDRRYRLAHVPGSGEAVLYDAFGNEVRLGSTGIVVTSGTILLGGTSAAQAVLIAGPLTPCPMMPGVGHLGGCLTTRAL